MDKNTIICNNCGLKGHLFKDCRAPVSSYGVILYKKVDSVPYILMIQRKDSLCYIDFLRGKYDIYNIQYIQTLFDKFSIEEKQKIVTEDFDKLWKDLWLIKDNKSNKFSVDYKRGKSKFIKITKGFYYNKLNIEINFDYFIQRSETNYLTSEWEFPKGRRNPNETNKECALRELTEETNFECNDYELLVNLSPLIEQYRGENQIKYKHIYYIGYLTNLAKKTKIDPDNYNQCSEIKDIAWLTKEKSLQYIRDYHSTRKKVIHSIFDFIDSLDNYIIV